MIGEKRFEEVVDREFAAPVESDGGRVVYRPAGPFGPVPTLRRGFRALGFDPRGRHPDQNDPIPGCHPRQTLALSNSQ